MRNQGRLQISAGVVSQRGQRPDNQDFAGVYLGSASEQAGRGIVAALADGVGGGKSGRMAAELAVHSLIDGFHAQSDTLGPAVAVERAIQPYNRWLCAMGRSETHAHTATTLTALVLRSRRAHVLHVGDSRAWHFRDGHLVQITEDHTHSHPDQRHMLYRALGIEERLRLDHHTIALAEHDRILLTSDGVHGVLSRRRLEKLLGARNSAESDAEEIVAAALAAGSADNASAVVIDIIGLPALDHDSIAGDLARLPIGPLPATGQTIDGFELGQVLSDGRYTRLFRALDTASGADVVVKFPKPTLLSDQGARAAFARELLVGARVNSPFVGSAIPQGEGQSLLYGVQPYYPGQTLEQRMKTAIPFAEALGIAIGLTRAVEALHRLAIIHRDIKPENVILTPGGGLKLVDLGVARLPRVEEFAADEIPGTPSYLAPEMFGGNAGDEATDQFALGVTLWRLFARQWPFGEAEAFARPRFRRPELPSKARPELPGWLDAVLMRCVALDPAERFGDAIELLRALEGGAAVERQPLRALPLIARYPVRFWQLVSLLLTIALLASLARH